MTDSKQYTVRGAEVIITASIYPTTVNVSITVDLSNLDREKHLHSPHQLINYLVLPGYHTRDTYWWCKTSRKITVRTGAQASRVIKHALAKIDDAVSEALIARTARESQMAVIFTA